MAALDTYLVLAGAFDDTEKFQLYEWAGRTDTPARLLLDDMGGLKTEELLVVDTSIREIAVQLLSDDGTDECKALPLEQRSFRARTVRLPV